MLADRVAPRPKRAAWQHRAEDVERGANRERDREAGVKGQAEQLRPGEPPVRGEPEQGADRAAQEHVLAARTRHRRRQVRVHQPVEDREHDRDRDQREHVHVRHDQRERQRDQRDRKRGRERHQVEQQRVPGRELPDQARRSAQEQPSRGGRGLGLQLLGRHLSPLSRPSPSRVCSGCSRASHRSSSPTRIPIHGTRSMASPRRAAGGR